jgi:NAD(P)-dependent dehydrogenase (short-subunit alcohol dehydrogenase family)
MNPTARLCSTEHMTPHTWLITGSSRGFGRALTVAALDGGDQVVATARTPAQLDGLTERYDERVLVVALDVTDAAAAASAFEAAQGPFGRVDVVVNNAGYANVAPVETAPEDDFRRQFETNFWGVYNVSKAALPVLKAQGMGTIVRFSSVGGRVGGTAGLGSYQAAKFAVDGLTRVLAAETAQLGRPISGRAARPAANNARQHGATTVARSRELSAGRLARTRRLKA